MAIVKVVKYDGTPDVVAWKYPSNELGTLTQVIVNETQEAVLYKGGQSLDWFGPGRHTLKTANIPGLNKVVNLPFGGGSPFTAEVWYVNKINNLAVKWGTPTPIQIQDPKYNIFIPLRSYGQFGIKIANSKVFLEKLVGTLSSFTVEDVTKYFKGAYLTNIKDVISTYLVEKKVSVLEINSHLNEISAALKEDIKPVFEEFGVELVSFFVNDISVPNDDPAVVKLRDALAKKAEMDIIGFNYVQERSFDTMEGAAKNPGGTAAPLMGAGMGLGMGMGMGSGFAGAFSEVGKNINTNPTKQCPHCNEQINQTAKFCPSCGKKTTNDEKMVKCSKCGTDNKEGVKFCAECGNTLIKACPKCGEKAKDGQKFCASCGTKIEGDE